MVLRRLVVAAPCMASAFVLADGHGWQKVLLWSAFGWTVLVQFVTNGFVRLMRRRVWLAVAGAVACSIGPAGWVWGAVYEIAGSIVVATCTAGVATLAFMFGWTWASQTDSITDPAAGRPPARPRRKSRVVGATTVPRVSGTR